MNETGFTEQSFQGDVWGESRSSPRGKVYQEVKFGTDGTKL